MVLLDETASHGSVSYCFRTRKGRGSNLGLLTAILYTLGR